MNWKIYPDFEILSKCFRAKKNCVCATDGGWIGWMVDLPKLSHLLGIFYREVYFSKTYVSQKLVEMVELIFIQSLFFKNVCVAKAGQNGCIDILLKSNFWTYVCHKISLKWLNWYSSDNKFASFPFLKLCVAIVLIHKDSPKYFPKSTFQKYVCRRSWLKGWIGCFKPNLISQNIFFLN